MRDSKGLELEVNERVVRAGDHRHAAQDEDGQKGHVGEHVHGGHGAGAAGGHGTLADHLAGRHGGVALLRGGDDGAVRSPSAQAWIFLRSHGAQGSDPTMNTGTRLT